MILVEVNNANIVYDEIVSSTKKEIISYFGTRNAYDLSPASVAIMVESEVTQEDIENLNKIIDRPQITLLAFKSWDASDRISGNIIDLS